MKVKTLVSYHQKLFEYQILIEEGIKLEVVQVDYSNTDAYAECLINGSKEVSLPVDFIINFCEKI